jgi:spore coat protein CotH
MAHNSLLNIVGGRVVSMKPGGRVFGGLEKSDTAFSSLTQNMRKFGNLANKATGGKMDNSELGQKITQAYNKVTEEMKSN